MDLRTENAWIYLLLLMILTDTVSVITQQQQCGPSQYLGEGSCKNCTNCTELGRNEVSHCTDSSDAVCSQNSAECTEGEFLSETMLCQACKVCGDLEEVSKACSPTTDTVCVPVPPSCPEKFVWDERQGCVLNCMLCPSKLCADTQSCMCNPSSNPNPCYADITCTMYICTDPPPEETDPNNAGSSSDNSLPTWGIGLVAIGIVIGIVAFSGCFLAMGFFTSRSRDPEEIGSEESQTSQNGLVTPTTHRNASGTTRLTFVSSPVFSQSAIEVLRNSPRLSPCNKAKHGGSSYKASPHSMRNSPRGNSPRRHSPKRTGHITPV